MILLEFMFVLSLCFFTNLLQSYQQLWITLWITLLRKDDFYMGTEKEELIAKIKEVLKPELTTISYETWILPLDIKNIEGNHIVFTTISEYQKDFIENKYKSLIFNTLRFITNKEWTFSVIDLSKKNNEEEDINDVVSDNDETTISPEVELNKSTLNPKYTFDTLG